MNTPKTTEELIDIQRAASRAFWTAYQSIREPTDELIELFERNEHSDDAAWMIAFLHELRSNLAELSNTLWNIAAKMEDAPDETDDQA